ncbi:hypothetical protein MMC25_000569 [Agyrium rufum]|nr:hypothetical protein [Agyrium rufum]
MQAPVLKPGDEPNPVDKTGLCLLSLDGGGVRGLSTLYILKGLMQRLNHERKKESKPVVRPCDVFDLIGGTSTGGLIAIMLGRLEMTVEACIIAYEELMKSVFEAQSNWLPIGWTGNTKARFDSVKLRKAIENVVTDSGASTEELLNNGQERGCRVFVCATAHETSGITRLRSYTLPNKSNISATICEAALATSAATGFFDPIQVETQKFEDGALGANNPAEEVEEEAANIWCSDSPLARKFLAKTLVDLVTETERTERRMIARWARLFTEKRYFRLNVEQGLQDVGLAEYLEQGKIKTATEEYLDHTQQDWRVKACVANLVQKQNPTNSTFEAILQSNAVLIPKKEHTVRMTELKFMFCNIPFNQNMRFVGRGEDLRHLRDEFLDSRKGKKIAITGLGGIGKTQIALQFAYEIRNELPDCSIFWIPAISREGLEQTYTAIVHKLKIPGYADKQADSKELLQRHLSEESPGRWITAVKLAHQNVIFVTQADEEMAVQMLRGYLIQTDLMNNMQEALGLLNELTLLHLAIVQAAAFIDENNIILAKYLELLAEQEEDVVDLLSEDFEDEGRDPGTNNPVAVTWLISFNQIHRRNVLAVEYLSFMACIEPIDIPQSMLPSGESRKQETEAIGLLKAYSFVEERTVTMTLNMHRLVHIATRNWLRKEGTFAERILETTIQLNHFLPPRDNTNRTLWRLCLPHVRRILGYEADEEEDIEAQMDVLWKFANWLHLDGKYDEAEEACTQILETKTRVLGKEHPDTTASMNSLALILRSQGQWKEAENLHVQVLEIFTRLLGEKDLDTLTSKNNLALSIQSQGRWKEAESLYMQVLEISTELLGEEYLNTISSKHHLALILHHQGQWKETEELRVQVLKIQTRVLGEKHPATLISMNCLAGIFQSQGRFKEAERIQVQVMEAQTSVLGQEHPDTLTSMSNLATIFQYQGRLKEAETLQVKVMEMQTKVLGETHPDTLTSKSNQALLICMQGRLEEAGIAIVQVLEACNKVLGKEHPNKILCMDNLVRIMKVQGRSQEAEELQEQVLRAKVSVFGKEHPQTLKSMHDLAATWYALGKMEKVEKLAAHILETRIELLGKEHPDTLTSMHNLACVWHALGRREEGRGLMVECVRLGTQVQGASHPQTMTSAKILDDWSKGWTVILPGGILPRKIPEEPGSL